MTATRAPLEPAPLLPRGIVVHGHPPSGAAESRRLLSLLGRAHLAALGIGHLRRAATTAVGFRTPRLFGTSPHSHAPSAGRVRVGMRTPREWTHRSSQCLQTACGAHAGARLNALGRTTATRRCARGTCSCWRARRRRRRRARAQRPHGMREEGGRLGRAARMHRDKDRRRRAALGFLGCGRREAARKRRLGCGREVGGEVGRRLGWCHRPATPVRWRRVTTGWGCAERERQVPCQICRGD